MRLTDEEFILARKHQAAITHLGVLQWQLRRCYSCFGFGDREVTIQHTGTGEVFKESWCDPCWFRINALLDFWEARGFVKQSLFNQKLDKGETIH